jgi:hypothetical protein
MGGFKEGTVNGWDNEDSDEDETGKTDRSTGGNAANDDKQSTTVTVDAGAEASVESETSETAASDIPWILRRNSITDGREQTVQLHLQKETLNVQRTQKSRIESQLGESVRKADLREAALLVGLQQTDDVVDVLKEWGYALK